jgi:hypothetical protein
MSLTCAMRRRIEVAAFTLFLVLAGERLVLWLC